MKVLRYGGRDWRRLVSMRDPAPAGRRKLAASVSRVLSRVRRDGDRALVELTRRYDGVRLTPARLRVPPAHVRAMARRADRGAVRALRAMARRVRAFHERQVETGFSLPVPGGGRVEERVLPVDSVGLYVPGGAGAYPTSVIMLAVPARTAGVPRIAVVTPPRTLESHPIVAAALVVAGVADEVYRVGGAQAVAALAYGTRTIPAVARIVGPGSPWVAEAKRQVRDRVGTDADAGPSEVVVLADATADAGLVAADLLAQAEHGSGAETVVLVTPCRELAEEVVRLVEMGRPAAANPAAVARTLRRGAAAVLVRDLDEGIAAVNALAAEHVEIQARGASRLADRVVAGAVFVGPDSPAAVGDYGIGPNHVLPTGGSARRASPLSVRDFQRRQSRVRLTRAALAHVCEDMVRLALAEGFPAHAVSVLTRFEA